ncbi:MAG: hypothetical protein M1825_001766 [Sarcosagium campestre]|nr:MAG: hypothetical protein M1825_001766 [Sarcosagium campestre]
MAARLGASSRGLVSLPHRPLFRLPLSTNITTAAALVSRRAFQTAGARLSDTAPVPVKKPVGAFRGGLFGFLFGSSLAGAAVYYYILEEYKITNELLTEDIYALTSQIQRIHTYVQTLDEKLDVAEKKRK